MRKIILIMVVTITICFGVTACSSKNDSSTTDSTKSQDETEDTTADTSTDDADSVCDDTDGTDNQDEDAATEIIYTEEYEITGDSGEGLSAQDAADVLTEDMLSTVYDLSDTSAPIYITLVDLQFVEDEECYVFQVNKEGYTASYYAVGYTGNIYENFGYTGPDSDGGYINDSEAENFAQGIQEDFANEDWSSLAAKVDYPIAIGTEEFANEEEFSSYDIGSLFSEEFKSAIADTDSADLFENEDGIMMGDGQIWFSDVQDADGNSLGFKIVVFNL